MNKKTENTNVTLAPVNTFASSEVVHFGIEGSLMLAALRFFNRKGLPCVPVGLMSSMLPYLDTQDLIALGVRYRMVQSMDYPTIQPSNHSTIKPSNNKIIESSNDRTIESSNHQTFCLPDGYLYPKDCPYAPHSRNLEVA